MTLNSHQALGDVVSEDLHEPLFQGNATAVGAPIEQTGLLGREVTLLSAIMLNVGQIIGSGIYAVPGSILNSVGSVGLLLLYWVISPIFAFAGLALYSELASMFPNSSGAEVIYLEQASPRPRFFVSTTFAVIAVLTSFSAANAVVAAQYLLTAFDLPVTSKLQTLICLVIVIIACGCVALSTKWSLRAVNVLTFLKIASLVFIVATGFAVLPGWTRIKDPYANFNNLFEGSTRNMNALTTAFVKVNHSFVGWHNAFNVLAEVRSKDPVRTVRKAGGISLVLISALFLFINVAYVAAVPREDISNSGQLIAVLFFRNVFGTTATRMFPLMVALSCFGNIIAVTIGQARILREVARQGFLTLFVILLVPAKDAFNFLLDLASYPNLVFHSAMSVGVWVLRRRRLQEGRPSSPLQARNSMVILYLALCLLLLVLPWVPPEPGHADVSFWYATYCVAGIGLLLCCGLYYWLWIIVFPKYGGYEIIEVIEESEVGTKNARLIRRYKNRDTEDERRPLIASSSFQ